MGIAVPGKERVNAKKRLWEVVHENTIQCVLLTELYWKPKQTHRTRSAMKLTTVAIGWSFSNQVIFSSLYTTYEHS